MKPFSSFLENIDMADNPHCDYDDSLRGRGVPTQYDYQMQQDRLRQDYLKQQECQSQTEKQYKTQSNKSYFSSIPSIFSSNKGEGKSNSKKQSKDQSQQDEGMEYEAPHNPIEPQAVQAIDKRVINLEDTKVSVPDFEKFKYQLSADAVEMWNENCICKRRFGIPYEMFNDFLISFSKQTGVHNTIVQKLRNLYIADGKKHIETFRTEESSGLQESKGMYGLIALNCNGGKINLLYSLHSVKFRLSPGSDLHMITNFFKSSQKFSVQDNYVRMKAFQSLKNQGYIDDVKQVKSLDDVYSQ